MSKYKFNVHWTGVAGLCFAIAMVVVGELSGDSPGAANIRRQLQLINFEIVLLIMALPFLFPLWIIVYFVKWYVLGALFTLIPWVKKHQKIAAIILAIVFATAMGAEYLNLKLNIPNEFRFVLNNQIRSSLYREIREKGTMTSATVMDFNERFKQKYFRYVHITIKISDPDNVGKYRILKLYEQWAYPVPRYQPGDTINVRYLKNSAISPQRFSAVTSNKLDFWK
jgi:hypothetical protein